MMLLDVKRLEVGIGEDKRGWVVLFCKIRSVDKNKIKINYGKIAILVTNL